MEQISIGSQVTHPSSGDKQFTVIGISQEGKVVTEDDEHQINIYPKGECVVLSPIYVLLKDYEGDMNGTYKLPNNTKIKEGDLLVKGSTNICDRFLHTSGVFCVSRVYSSEEASPKSDIAFRAKNIPLFSVIEATVYDGS